MRAPRVEFVVRKFVPTLNANTTVDKTNNKILPGRLQFPITRNFRQSGTAAFKYS